MKGSNEIVVLWYNNHGSIQHEYVSYNGKKFKLYYDIHNGGSHADIYVMTNNGDWAIVANRYALNVNMISYISRDEDFLRNWGDVKKEMYKFIKAVY